MRPSLGYELLSSVTALLSGSRLWRRCRTMQQLAQRYVDVQVRDPSVNGSAGADVFELGASLRSAMLCR